MSESRISIRLIGDPRYQPGEKLAGEFFVDIDEPHDIRVVEVSVLWFTEGKGDEDMAVHYFQRIGNDNGQFIDMRQSQHFETDLPSSPLSYDGVIVKIQWCVRIRVFMSRGRDMATEQPFRLGTVPRGLPVKVDEPMDEARSSEELPAAPPLDTTPSDTTPPETIVPETTAPEVTPPGQTALDETAPDATVNDIGPVDAGADDSNAPEISTADPLAETGTSDSESDVMDADMDSHTTELDRIDTDSRDSGGPSD